MKPPRYHLPPDSSGERACALSARNHGLENFGDSLYPYESDGSQTTKSIHFTGEELQVKFSCDFC